MEELDKFGGDQQCSKSSEREKGYMNIKLILGACSRTILHSKFGKYFT